MENETHIVYSRAATSTRCSTRLGLVLTWHRSSTVYLSGAFCFAQRFRCASPILFRAAALILRRLRTGAAEAAFLVPSVESRARTLSSRAVYEPVLSIRCGSSNH